MIVYFNNFSIKNLKQLILYISYFFYISYKHIRISILFCIKHWFFYNFFFLKISLTQSPTRFDCIHDRNVVFLNINPFILHTLFLGPKLNSTRIHTGILTTDILIRRGVDSTTALIPFLLPSVNTNTDRDLFSA